MLKLCQISLIQTRPHVCLRSTFDKSRIMNYCRIIKSNLFSLIDSFIIVTCFQFTSPSLLLFLPRFWFEFKLGWKISIDGFAAEAKPPTKFFDASQKSDSCRILFFFIFKIVSMVSVRWSPDLKCNNDSLTIKHQIQSQRKGRVRVWCKGSYKDIYVDIISAIFHSHSKVASDSVSLEP